VLDYNEIVVSESVGGWKGNEVFDKDFEGCGGYLIVVDVLAAEREKCGSPNDWIEELWRTGRWLKLGFFCWTGKEQFVASNVEGGGDVRRI
jgi:hypothetical protein